MQLSECLLTPGTEQATELVERLELKRDLLSAGDSAHAEVKTALVIGPGAMRGVYSGGVAMALERLGYTNAFDEVVGVSAGAATAAYYLGGQAEEGTSIYHEDLTGRRFINPARAPKLLDMGYLECLFREHKPLDVGAIRSSRSNLHLGLTDVANLTPTYLHVNRDTDTDIVQHVLASSSVPGVTSHIEIDGVSYSDGMTTCRNPVRYAVEELGCTDVLYIANEPLRHTTASLGELILSKLCMRDVSKGFASAHMARHEGSDSMRHTEYPDDIRIGVLCPERSTIGYLTTDAARLAQVAVDAQQQAQELFDKNLISRTREHHESELPSTARTFLPSPAQA